MTHSLLDTLIQHCALVTLPLSDPPRSNCVNYEEHDIHGIAFRVRKAEEAEDGEIEGHTGDEREYQRVAVSPEIMRAPYPCGVERAD